VDVEGGWYDAGDFLKFTHTTAYALIGMLTIQRDTAPIAGLATETRHGLDWLDKLWDADTGTLYTQVGISIGLQSSGQPFPGDHDTWRLPQTDDRLAARPVFRAAGPAKPLSPNLAGRVATAFAFAADRSGSRAGPRQNPPRRRDGNPQHRADR
jgi:hypothetical protein